MAFFLSQPRLLACFLFLVLHFCFASSLELPSLRKLHQDGEVSMIKRAVGKTFEIPFDVTVRLSIKYIEQLLIIYRRTMERSMVSTVR